MKRGISSSDRRPFGVQLAERLRTEIGQGRFKPGERLPSVRGMAAQFGVSVRVVRDAVLALVEDGILSSRPKVGITVLAKKALPKNLGTVLLVLPGANDIFFANVVAGEIENILTQRGYAVRRVAVPRVPAGMPNLSYLRRELAESPDIAFVNSADERILRVVSAAGVPYVYNSRRPIRQPGSVGRIDHWHPEIMMRVVERSRQRGVRRVLLVRLDNDFFALAEDFQKGGIDVDEIIVRRPNEPHVLFSIQSDALNRVAERLSCGRKPDLIVFSDDYLASGGMTSVLLAGLRVPEDVRVLTFSNRYLGPVFSKPFTRMEIDAVNEGRKVAGGLMQYLKKGAFPRDLHFELKWIEGATF